MSTPPIRLELITTSLSPMVEKTPPRKGSETRPVTMEDLRVKAVYEKSEKTAPPKAPFMKPRRLFEKVDY